MKKQNNQIVIYRRNCFGFLIKIAAFNKNQFKAIISTNGVLKICTNNAEDRNTPITAAYAAGEWHICTTFNVDRQS